MIKMEEIDSIGTILEEKGMSHSDIDLYFEHYGVPGMKWGKRRLLNRSLNKESRLKDQKDRRVSIEKDRNYFRSGKGQNDSYKARQKYNSDKVNIGSREARKVLNAFKDEQWSRAKNANKVKTGKELAIRLGSVGVMSLAFTTAAYVATKAK